MDPRLVEATRLVDAGLEALRKVAEVVQAECKHHRVYHRDGYVSWFRHNTIRVCAECGLEEQTGPYHHQPYHFVQLKTEFASKEKDPTSFRLKHGAGSVRTVEHGKYVCD